MKWRVWNPEASTEDMAKVFERSEASWACEDWAERDDMESADYMIVGGERARVCARQVDDEGKPVGPVRYFEVAGEAVPSYSANEMDIEEALEPVLMDVVRELDEDVWKSLHEHHTEDRKEAIQRRRTLCAVMKRSLLERGLIEPPDDGR